MNAQEQQMLQGLVDRVNRTPANEKDPEAEQMIQQTLGRNPDALYLLAQTVLVQEYALNQAQRQLADLRRELEQTRRQPQETKHSGSFLGNLLGRHEEPQRTPPPPPPPPQQGAPAQYGSGPGAGPASAYGTGPGLAYPTGGYPIPGVPPAPQQGGFLRSAMTTAAGVAAGALAFQGIESLMHGFGHAAGYGTEFSGGGFGSGQGRPEEIINNNYYGDSGSNHEPLGGDPAQGFHEHSSASDSGTGDHANAIDRGGFNDAAYAAGDGGANDTLTNPDGVGGAISDPAGDYTGGDDSQLADDIGEQDDSDDDFGGDDSGGDFGGDDSGGDFGGDDSGGDFDSGGDSGF